MDLDYPKTDMDVRLKHLINNIGILTLSNFASKILVFLLLPLYTSVLSTGEVGIYDLVVSSTQLLFPIMTLNITDATMRFLLDKDTSDKEVSIISLKYMMMGCLLMLIIATIIGSVLPYNGVWGYWGWIILYAFFYSFNQYFIQFAKGRDDIAAMGIAGVLGTAVMVFANCLMLLVFKWQLTGFFIASILGQAVPTIYLFCRIRYWEYLVYPKAINKCLQKEMLLYSVPLIATSVGWWVNSSADKYVVSLFHGVSSNGLLSVSYKIPAIIIVLQQIFIQAWHITAIKEYENEDSDIFYSKMFEMVNIFLVIACSWMIIMTRVLAFILFKKEFYDAWQYVPFLLIASILNGSAGVLGPILSAQKASKAMALSAVYGALVNILLNVILVYFIGIQGATIATVISSATILAVRKKALKKQLRVAKNSRIQMTWFLLLVQAVIEIYMRGYVLQILILLVIHILHFKTIIESIKYIIKESGDRH